MLVGLGEYSPGFICAGYGQPFVLSEKILLFGGCLVEIVAKI
jgi:hypothetical protein